MRGGGRDAGWVLGYCCLFPAWSGRPYVSVAAASFAAALCCAVCGVGCAVRVRRRHRRDPRLTAAGRLEGQCRNRGTAGGRGNEPARTAKWTPRRAWLCDRGAAATAGRGSTAPAAARRAGRFAGGEHASTASTLGARGVRTAPLRRLGLLTPAPRDGRHSTLLHAAACCMLQGCPSSSVAAAGRTRPANTVKAARLVVDTQPCVQVRLVRVLDTPVPSGAKPSLCRSVFSQLAKPLCELCCVRVIQFIGLESSVMELSTMNYACVRVMLSGCMGMCYRLLSFEGLQLGLARGLGHLLTSRALWAPRRRWRRRRRALSVHGRWRLRHLDARRAARDCVDALQARLPGVGCLGIACHGLVGLGLARLSCGLVGGLAGRRRALLLALLLDALRGQAPAHGRVAGAPLRADVRAVPGARRVRGELALRRARGLVRAAVVQAGRLEVPARAV